jgi:hypothetical protein
MCGAGPRFMIFFFGAALCSRAPVCGRVPKVVLPSALNTEHLKKILLVTRAAHA